MKALVLTALAAGCSWTQFDDLSNSAWAHAQESPDSNQSNYGVGVVNATTDSAGLLAVLSDSPANYSTLAFDPTGSTNETLTEPLGGLSITTLSQHPAFIGDGSGDVAIVDKGVDGPLVVIHGTAGQLTDSQVSSTNPVDAATFLGNGNIIVTSAGTTPSSAAPNAFVVAATVSNCILLDNANMPLAAAAVTSDGTTLWAYTRGGAIVSYDDFSKCDSTQMPMPTPPSGTATTTAAAAANGGYLTLVGNNLIAVAYDSPSTTSGTLSIVTKSSTALTALTLPVPGVAAAAFGAFGASPAMPALALGFPSRTVGTTTDAGEVELHTVDTSTGTVAGDIVVLSIPEASANLVFGRALAAMTFNGETILVAGANNVVYAYYETMLYSDTRRQ